MAKTINIVDKYERTIVLVDMDCFYCQVEEKLNPLLKGKPIAVVQYNAWKGGGIIAVNYPARDRGVTRYMRGDEAKKHCPDIELVKVPNVREKADLSKYRDAGKDVASVLQTFTTLLERASVDEAYLDITENVNKRFREMNDGTFSLTPDKLVNSYVVGYQNIGDFIQNISNNVKPGRVDSGDSFLEDDNGVDGVKNISKYDIKLLIGASIVNEIRQAVKVKTGYECSAGIAHNKILAKLVCGMNKPNKQTVLPLKSVNEMFSCLPVQKIKGLGGKFGEDVCEALKIKFMSEIKTFTQAELQKRFDDKTGLWLYNMSRGIDLESVTPRFASKSIGCCKNFPGRNSIKGIATLNHWLTELSKEIIERLEKDEMENNRVAKQMVVSFTQQFDNEDVASTRSVPLNLVDVETMARDALELIKKNTSVFYKTDQNTVLLNPIKLLGISVSKFEDTDRQKKNSIKDMFTKAVKSDATQISEDELKENDEVSKKSSVKNDQKNESSLISFFTAEHNVKPDGNDFTDREVEESNDIIDDANDNTELITLEHVKTNIEIDMSDIPSNYDDRNEPVAGPSNYMHSYAEFVRPVIPDDFYETCTQCNKKLLLTEMQSHMDMHLAFQLSQEQRIQFRSQLKTNQSPFSHANNAKKPKLDRNASTNLSSSSGSKGALSKYLVKHNSDVPDSSVRCDECGKYVIFDEVTEHSDYHAAKKLQFELNSSCDQSLGSGSTTNNNNHIVVRSNKNVKGKRGNNSTTNTLSVASFFKKKN